MKRKKGRKRLRTMRQFDRTRERFIDRDIRLARHAMSRVKDPAVHSRGAERKRPICPLCKDARAYTAAWGQFPICSFCYERSGRPSIDEQRRLAREARDAEDYRALDEAKGGPWSTPPADKHDRHAWENELPSCPKCEARVAEPCRTPAGGRRNPHSDRPRGRP